MHFRATHKIAFGIYAVLIVIYVFALPSAWAESFDYYFSEAVFLAILVVLLLHGWLTSASYNARTFFGLLAIACGFWYSIRFSTLLNPFLSVSEANLVSDVLFLGFFVTVAVAIELRFDARKDRQWMARYIGPALGGALIIFAIFGYFSIIPSAVDDRPYETLLPVHLALDAYLGLRFLIVSAQATDPRWRTLYLLLAVAFLLVVIADALVWIYRAGVLEYTSGSLVNVVWYLWYPVAYCATAVDPHGFGRPADGDTAAGDYPNTNGLLLFGFAMPLIHVGGYSLGLLDESSRALRDLFVACWLIVIAASVVLLYRFIYSRMDLLEKRRASAEMKASRFEEQLHRELRIRSLGRLASGLAHDFGNTMTALQMHAVAAERRVKRGEAAKAEFEGVRKSVEYAKNMVGQLKLFGAANQRVNTEPVSLVEEVRKTLKLVEPSLPDGVSLTFSHVANEPEILALPSMLHQVVTNYVHNAIDAVGEHGEIEVIVEYTDITDRCRSCGEMLHGRYAMLKVCDSGDGVSETLEANIFEPLVTTKPVGLGSGLGLASVHGIMHKLGGHVGLTDSPSGGACFIAYFPLRTAES